MNINDNSKKFEIIQKLQKHEDKVWCLSWHPTEDILASCGSDKNICIWSYIEETCNYILKAILEEGHSKTIRSISWDYTGNLLASASFDGTINIWKKSNFNFECIAVLEGHENEVKSVSWSRSGSFLSSCSRDKNIWVYKYYNLRFGIMKMIMTFHVMI